MNLELLYTKKYMTKSHLFSSIIVLSLKIKIRLRGKILQKSTIYDLECAAIFRLFQILLCNAIDQSQPSYLFVRISAQLQAVPIFVLGRT